MLSYSTTFYLPIINLLGLMSNSAKYFCAWCETEKDRKKHNGEKRTIESIKKNFINWRDQTGSNKKYAMSYKNCINDPLIISDDNQPIISFIPPPELHILIGVVGHLYNALEKECPEVAVKWLKVCNIQFFHGLKQFNGNSARQLLKRHKDLKILDHSK